VALVGAHHAGAHAVTPRLAVGRCTDSGCRACARYAPILLLLTPAAARAQDTARVLIPRRYCARHRLRVGYDVGKLGIGEATWRKIVAGSADYGFRVTRARVALEWTELN
jgi:hypothetical protein